MVTSTLAKNRKDEYVLQVNTVQIIIPNGGGTGRGPKGPISGGGGPYRVGGGTGLPKGAPKRGDPGNGGGPLGGMLTCRKETKFGNAFTWCKDY